MKKLILILGIVANIITASAQDSLFVNKKDGSIIPYSVSDVDSISFTRNTNGYVIVNGVKWAIRNVASPGSFTSNPENAGMFYQWNSNNAWSTTGNVTGWNSSWTGGYTTASVADAWISTNDPSPAGFRVPTKEEISTLLDPAKVTTTWITTTSGVIGTKFTDISTGSSIFLPASGYRNNTGTLTSANSYGGYWSNSGKSYTLSSANQLSFNLNGASLTSSGNRANGFSIRPVAK